MPEYWSFEIVADSEDQSGLIVARPDLANLFILNHSARFLWLELQKRQSYFRDQALLAERFASHFSLPFSVAKSDVEATFQNWSQSLLLPSDSDLSEKEPNVPMLASAVESPPLAFPDFSLGSTRFRLIANDPAFVAEIQPRLAHLFIRSSFEPDYIIRVVRDSDSASFHLFRDTGFFASAPDAAVARTLVLQEVARLAHGPDAAWLCILHAAALAHPSSSRAILFPAATNSGKSTLTAALLHSGFRVLSDDSAAVLTTNEVLPLPFALMLREGSWPVLEPYFPELAHAPVHNRYGDLVRFLAPFTDVTGGGPAKPECLVFVDYQQQIASKGTGALLPLDPLQTFCHLQRSGFWVPHTRPAIAAFINWVQSLRAYRLSYSDLPEAISIVRDLISIG